MTFETCHYESPKTTHGISHENFSWSQSFEEIYEKLDSLKNDFGLGELVEFIKEKELYVDSYDSWEMVEFFDLSGKVVVYITITSGVLIKDYLRMLCSSPYFWGTEFVGDFHCLVFVKEN